MQAGAGGFAYGIQVLDVGAAFVIGHDAAATVMRRRYHRDRRFADVYAIA